MGDEVHNVAVCCIVPLADDEVARAQHGAAGMFATSLGDTVAKAAAGLTMAPSTSAAWYGMVW